MIAECKFTRAALNYVHADEESFGVFRNVTNKLIVAYLLIYQVHIWKLFHLMNSLILS